MRKLAFGERKSGRTTLLAHEIAKDMANHSNKVYIVAGNYSIARYIRKYLIESLNSEPERIIPVTIENMNMLKGTDPLNIYFEHTSYENANSSQLLEIYRIEDKKQAIIWGAP